MTGIKKLLENNTSPEKIAHCLAFFLTYKQSQKTVILDKTTIVKNYLNKTNSYNYQIVFLILGHRNNIMYD